MKRFIAIRNKYKLFERMLTGRLTLDDQNLNLIISIRFKVNIHDEWKKMFYETI